MSEHIVYHRLYIRQHIIYLLAELVTYLKNLFSYAVVGYRWHCRN